MPKVHIEYKTDVQSKVTFDGVVEPDGSTGYKFSGTLIASCGLDRSGTGFENTLRFQHGGAASDYKDIDFILKGSGDNKIPIAGKGDREPNDTVDFRISFNEGSNGQFPDSATSNRLNVIPGGPWQKLDSSYLNNNIVGGTEYDVRFNGRARADGPDGYVIEGTFVAAGGQGSMMTQYAKFCYKSSSESWSNKTYDCERTPLELNVTGRRKAGDKVYIQVGTTSGLLNTYEYGSEVSCELQELF